MVGSDVVVDKPEKRLRKRKEIWSGDHPICIHRHTDTDAYKRGRHTDSARIWPGL